MSRTARSKAKTIRIEIYVDDVDKHVYECVAFEMFSYELYGDDADGNHGEMRWESDGVEVEEFSIDGKAVDGKELPERVLDLLTQVIEETEFESEGR